MAYMRTVGKIGRPVEHRASQQQALTASDGASRGNVHVDLGRPRPMGTAMPPAEKKPTLLTVAQVAQYLQISEGKIRDHVKGKCLPKLPCIRFGSSIRFRQDTLDRFIETLEKRSVA